MRDRNPASESIARGMAARRRIERLAIFAAAAERDPMGYAPEALQLHRAIGAYFDALDLVRTWAPLRRTPEPGDTAEIVEGAIRNLEHAEKMLRACADWPMPAGPAL